MFFYIFSFSISINSRHIDLTFPVQFLNSETSHFEQSPQKRNHNFV